MLNIDMTPKFIPMILMIIGITACNGDSDNPVPLPPADINLSGYVMDGPVTGGTIYVFTADTIMAALEAANNAADRAASLASASPLVELQRAEADGAQYTLDIPGENTGQALFLIFDATGATDETFRDVPFNLETAIIAGSAGSQQVINLSPHTTLVSIQVRNALDPEDDGIVISALDIENEINNATASLLAAIGTDENGIDLFVSGDDPATTDDIDSLEEASTFVGGLVRNAAIIVDGSTDNILALLAADSADGIIDAMAPTLFELSVEEQQQLAEIAAFELLGKFRPGDGASISCSASADALRRSCEFELLDEYFVGAAICADTSSQIAADDCMATINEAREELILECAGITQARLDLCTQLSDAIHEPVFGPAWSGNFVNPMLIGDSVTPNAYFPMVQGNEWVYEGTFIEDGEEITESIRVTVTNKTKLIEGITCLVVRDVVTIDGELIEDTDDWFAQDVDGNIWYCGEEVKDFETFEGDVPANPELVAIDGAFKAGREGDEAGLLLPANPVAGDIFRQEMSVANAEDAVEILAVDATESSVAASCDGNCLLTLDFSPLDPEAQENKYYAPGVGLILEVDLETGDRVELIEFIQTVM